MPEESQVIEVFLNEKEQIVAKDSQDRWRVYDPISKKLTLFADGPARGAKPLKEPEPEPIGSVAPEVVVNQPAASAANPQTLSPDQVEITWLKTELDVARKEADDAKVAEGKAKVALNDAVRNQGVTAGELSTARSRIAELEAEVAKAKSSDQLTEKDKLLGEKDAVIGKRDARIKELEGLLKAEKEKPQTAYEKVGPVKKIYKDYPKPAWAASAVLVCLVLFYLVSGVVYWHSPSVPSAPGATQVATVPADYDAMRSNLAELKAKDEARQKAATALVDALKNSKPLAPLIQLNKD